MKSEIEIPTAFPPSFAIHDLNIAAFLLASGARLVRTHRRGGRVYFSFDSTTTPSPSDLQTAYLNGEKVSATLFTKALSDLKGIIFGDDPQVGAQ